MNTSFFFMVYGFKIILVGIHQSLTLYHILHLPLPQIPGKYMNVVVCNSRKKAKGVKTHNFHGEQIPVPTLMLITHSLHKFSFAWQIFHRYFIN